MQVLIPGSEKPNRQTENDCHSQLWKVLADLSVLPAVDNKSKALHLHDANAT